MTGLQDLPFETLERICELISGSRPSNLIPFSEVSKTCLAASSQSLWHTIPLYIRRQDQLPEDISRLKRIIQTRLSRNARVRCISVAYRLALDDRRDRRSTYRSRRVSMDDTVWIPLADILAEIPPLSEFEWESDKLPFCILRSLNSRHPGCKLRIMGVKPGVDRPLGIDDQPARKLSFMYELLLPLHNDYVCHESLNTNEANSSEPELYELILIGSLSASLTQFKHRDAYSPDPCHVSQPGPSEFELVSRSSKNMVGPGTRYKAATLSSLDLISQSHPSLREWIRRSDIVLWSILTHFPALRTFKSQWALHSSAIEWLTAEGILGSLKTLNIVLYREGSSQDSTFLLRFLRSLPQLDILALAGETYPAQGNQWISRHAPSLKRLQLTTVDPHNSTFDLDSLRTMMRRPLPLLEHLSITLKRSKGDSAELEMYKILGAMPRLQSIVLGLDSSIPSQHTELWPQRRRPGSKRDPRLTDPYIMDALINSAVDEKLAIAIFRAISAAKSDRSLPLERLEVHPDSRCKWTLHCFGMNWMGLGTDWMDVMQHIERSWLVKRRYPGLGSDELSASQIQPDRVGMWTCPPKTLKEPTELIFRRVWPVHPGTEGDWQKDWHSFPLDPEKMPNQHELHDTFV